MNHHNNEPRIIFCRDYDTYSTRWNKFVIKYAAKLVGAVSTLVDRTDHNNIHRFEYSPIPKEHTTYKSFEDCCLEAAEQIWKSYDKPIHVAWSGGIDSTAVLISMLETKPHDRDLHVRFTEESIKEFPSYYEKVVSKNWDPTPTKDLYDTIFYSDENFLKISGDCGDQVFGSDSVVDNIDAFHSPWETIKKWDLEDIYSYSLNNIYESDFQMRDTLFEFLHEHTSYCPFEIKTIYDLYWWVNFSLKWQHVKYRMPITFSAGIGHSSAIAFFDTTDFQKWSLSNHDIKHNTTWTSYKQPAKDFIHKYHHDLDYLKHKKKVGSGKKSSRKGGYIFSPKLILSDGRIWRKGDTIPKRVDEQLLLPDDVG